MVVSISGEPKLALSSTWMRYDVAPLAPVQLKPGVVSQVLVPSAGEERLGVEGVVRIVTLQADDQEPSPQALEACTRQ